MMIQNLGIRLARLDESDKILAWRNDPKVRIGAEKPDEISKTIHSIWFNNKILANQFFIAEKDGEEFGIVVFHKDEEDLIWSFYVIPEKQKKGLGKLLTRLGLLLAENSGEQVLYADVRDDNEISLRLHHELGFVTYAAKDGLIKFYKEFR